METVAIITLCSIILVTTGASALWATGIIDTIAKKIKH